MAGGVLGYYLHSQVQQLEDTCMTAAFAIIQFIMKYTALTFFLAGIVTAHSAPLEITIDGVM